MEISNERLLELKRLEEDLGYHFNDISKLNLAMIHSSYVNENNIPKNEFNERYEFLGDAVLELAVSDYLFNKYPNSPEGVLTKKRAQMVCEKSFSHFGELLNLGDHLLLGKGEELTGGRKKASILADSFEALCGAIYLDGGYEFVSSRIVRLIESTYFDEEKEVFIDYKSKFQEYAHKNNIGNFSYKLVSEKGPSHDKSFLVDLSIKSRLYSQGVGKSIKKAEQNAAKNALIKLGVIDE